MKKLILAVALWAISVNMVDAQTKETKSEKDHRMEWWREARFGMFIHWGVYSQWAGVYHGHERQEAARSGL